MFAVQNGESDAREAEDGETRENECEALGRSRSRRLFDPVSIVRHFGIVWTVVHLPSPLNVMLESTLTPKCGCKDVHFICLRCKRWYNKAVQMISTMLIQLVLFSCID